MTVVMRIKKPSKYQFARHTRFDAFDAKSVEPPPQPPQLAFGAVSAELALACGLTPDALPKTPSSKVALRKPTAARPTLTDDEWATIEPTCKLWKQNRISFRSHRETVVACLFLAKTGLGWSYCPDDLCGPSGQSALRQRAICWAVSLESRWDVLLATVESAGTWRPQTVELLRAICSWGSRVRTRITAERERVREAATHHGVLEAR